MAACSRGMRVILTEPTDWIGGQLTSQAVPPDEHPWIEQFGCTARYRDYRKRVRRYYREHTPLKPEAGRGAFNPGGGWVSALCHEPKIGVAVLEAMLQPALAAGLLEVRLGRVPRSVDRENDHIRSVTFRNLDGQDETIEANFVLDATELGDLLPLAGVEYSSGAESRAETSELHAVEGPAQPDNVQGFTWVLALALDEGSHRVIDRPEGYEFWRAYQPDFWPGPLLGFEVLHAHTGERRTLPLFSDDWYALFPYRQIVDPAKFASGTPHPVTLVNWPQNDYFLRNVIDKPADEIELAFQESRALSLSLLYWLQTEAPRHDGGVGYPGLYARPDVTGTPDGSARAPYIRESRRIRGLMTITEEMVTEPHPSFPDRVGVGSYRIDLHPSASGAGIIDLPTRPFEIPLRALIPTTVENLLPAAKNIATTHITNGAYRLHPIEWNIGEVAGLLASVCVRSGSPPAAIAADPNRLADFQALLTSEGVEIAWPSDFEG